MDHNPDGRMRTIEPCIDGLGFGEIEVRSTDSQDLVSSRREPFSNG